MNMGSQWSKEEACFAFVTLVWLAVNHNTSVTSMFKALSHTFVEIDHEIISTAILLHSADSRRVVVSYEQKYALKVVKLAQEKKCG